jgi:DNA invertase Pin-like site-specific DNA recombinase
MNIGYSRVSTEGQTKSTEAQILQLQKAGCEMIYQENESGGKRERKELNKALDHIRRGDVLIVCKLDRLSRSLVDLLGILKKIEDAGAEFRSLGESIETQSPAGKMMMHMLGAFAEFERDIIRERVKKGLKHARDNGRIGGGRYKLSPEEQQEAKRLILTERKSQGFVAKKYGVDRSTISRMMNEIRLKAELKGEIL